MRLMIQKIASSSHLIRSPWMNILGVPLIIVNDYTNWVDTSPSLGLGITIERRMGITELFPRRDNKCTICPPGTSSVATSQCKSMFTFFFNSSLPSIILVNRENYRQLHKLKNKISKYNDYIVFLKKRNMFRLGYLSTNSSRTTIRNF